ncbi:hypothetical protein [Ancylomarina sp.]|uniref:hypothetical protein n=1 Tax=Ancylomarina sp. TaxID=1970196 RepID=UPI003567A35D
MSFPFFEYESGFIPEFVLLVSVCMYDSYPDCICNLNSGDCSSEKEKNCNLGIRKHLSITD